MKRVPASRRYGKIKYGNSRIGEIENQLKRGIMSIENKLPQTPAIEASVASTLRPDRK